MGEETGSWSKFKSMPFYKLDLKITTYSIYHGTNSMHLRSFSIAQARRMSQFQTFTKSHDTPLNSQTLISVVFIDVTIFNPKLTNG